MDNFHPTSTMSKTGDVIISVTRRMAVTPPKVWRYITDSDLFNRHLGLPSLETTMRRDRDDLNLPSAVMTFLGFSVARQSDPLIEWSAPFWFLRRREFDGSPWRSITSYQTLSTDDSTTLATYRMNFDVRWWFKPFFVVGRHYIKWRITSFLRKVEELARISIEPVEFSTRLASLDRALCQARYANHSVDSALLECLLDWLASADERALQRIQPLALAVQLKVDRKELLKLLLVGNIEGLFDLNWELVCPSCRGVSVQSSELKNIKSGYHCDTCRLDLTSDFDEALEITFTPTPLIREVTRNAFCYGYPAQTPHVILQRRLNPQVGCQVERSSLNRVSYWVLPFKLRGELTLVNATKVVISESDVEVVNEADGAAGEMLSVENRTDSTILLQFQEPLETQNCLTAAKLTSMQDFRELLAKQILAPDVTLGIRNLTILFTDLKGSTAMYSQIGDAPAFERVKRHFDILIGIVREYNGAVVKTIGDSVMAVFADPLDAIRASFVMHEAIRETGLILKVGINAGPCIAINQNDVLDYFGTTVNLAARIESLSGGEILLSRTLYDSRGVADLIQQQGLTILQECVPIRGFASNIDLVRLGSAG